MTWAGKRRLKYFLFLLLILLIILLIIFYPLIFKSPTCSDNKQNGEETGIDCGGSCSLICETDTKDPVIIWSRAFPINDSSYNLVALVENQNTDGAIKNISYQFKIYNSNNSLIGVETGETFLPANGRYAIFGPRFDTTELSIRSVTFEFTSDFVFYKKENYLDSLPISINDIVFDTDKDSSKLSAVMKNDSIYDLPSFDIIAIFYDEDGNAINASRTYKNKLVSDSETDLIFTWPIGFTETPNSYDILPMINPFDLDF